MPLKGILSRGPSRNSGPQGKKIIFKQTDKTVLKCSSKPDSYYEVLTMVKEIPSRMDPVNQWPAEEANVPMSNHTSGSIPHPNATANLIDDLKVLQILLFFFFL